MRSKLGNLKTMALRTTATRQVRRGALDKEEPTRLHISSSQKHIRPVPVPSIMHTWSTMNKFICSWDVQVLRTLSYAAIFNIYESKNEILWLYKKNCYFFGKEPLTWFSISDHFNAAPVAGHQWRLITWKRRVIERIFASQVRPRVAFVAINRSRCKNLKKFVFV